MPTKSILPTKEVKPVLDHNDLVMLNRKIGNEPPGGLFAMVMVTCFMANMGLSMVKWALGIDSLWFVLAGVGSGLALYFALRHYGYQMHMRGSVYMLLWVERHTGVNGEKIMQAMADDVANVKIP